MKRAWRSLVALLAVQAVLAGGAATLDWSYACGACRAGGFSLGLPGFAFYVGLLLAAVFSGPGRLVFSAALFGFGIHVMLVVQLLWTGVTCWLCFGAALVSLLIAALAVACERSNLLRAALVLPWSILFVLGWMGLPRTIPNPVPEAAPVRILVYDQADCPFCDELRDRILPEIEREFGPRVSIIHRPAADLPAIRLTPTVIVASTRDRRPARVFEGLPTLEVLMQAIREVEEPS